MTQTNICILGGGFGGLYTALRLSQLSWEGFTPPQITLVDQSDRFVFLPLLYELLTHELETWEIAPPFEELLAGTGIQFVRGTVTAIDAQAKQVQIQTARVQTARAQAGAAEISPVPQVLTYDRLVLALGGETPLEMALGAADYALPFRSVEDAYRLEEKLRRLEASDQDRIRIVVAGGGYSGVELACKLAERLGDRGRIRIVELADKILRNSPEFNRESAQKALEALGVWVDLETRIQAIRADEIDLEYKDQRDTVPVDLVVWTVGTQVVPVVQALELPKGDRGQILIRPTLDVVDHPEIFALGDLAIGVDAEAQNVPATAQAAFQQADYVGWNIWASLTQRPLLPFHYQNLGEMMSLGKNSATLTGLGVTLNGPLAHVARRLVYLARMPTLDHQLRVGFNWMTKPIQDLIRTAVPPGG